MTNQELLKAYSAYLPYEVKVMFEGEELKHSLVGLDTTSTPVKLIGFYGDYGQASFEFSKLVLRPLSDLTKEIEHNGGRFIPIELIGKLFIEKGGFYEGFFGWDLPTGGDDYQDYYLTIEHKEENLWMNTWCGRPDEGGYEIESHVLEYTAFFQLIKWHFDVFGLIEKGLAININDLKEEKRNKI